MSTLPFPHSAPEDGERRTIGRYEILHRIGGGSMGVVYLAQDPVIDRLVALKTLSTRFPIDSADLDGLRRQFFNEAKSAGALSHPGIVTVHDLIDDPETGEVSIAMEYVPGDTLRQILNRPQPPPLHFIADVVRQIAEVLDFAHAKGVVHRDIKPANVIVSEDQRVKVADFGIASLGGRGLAGDLEAMGTPNYLAPERILGLEADHRADVYSLGVLLYEMLTRHLPFTGENLAELALNTVQNDPTPLATHRPDLVQPFHRLVDRALAKDPDERYQRAGEIAEALDEVVLSQARLSDTLPLPDVAHLLATGAAEAAAAPVQEEPPAAEAEEPDNSAPAAASTATETSSGDARRGLESVRGRLAPLATRALAAVRLSGRRRRQALIAGGGLLLLALAIALGVLISGPSEESLRAEAELNEEQLRQLEYLALLQQVQQLYDAGETEVAERLLDEAALISPEAARVRQMREAARQRVADEHAALREAQIVDLVLRAQEALERGDVATAGAAVYKALELDPENESAIETRAIVETRQRRLARAARQKPEPVRLAEPVVAAPVPPPVTVAVEPVQVVPQPPPATDGTLRVELRSERPRGVLTIYSGTTQVYRRGYRFVERKNFLRRKGRSGGFDDELRLDAGELALRVYLSIPGEATRSLTVSGELEGGGSATLRVEVDPKGEMAVRLR